MHHPARGSPLGRGPAGTPCRPGVGHDKGGVEAPCYDPARNPKGRRMPKRAIYQRKVDGKWVVIELPDDYKDGDRFPLRGSTDQWFDSRDEARAELLREQQRISRCSSARSSVARGWDRVAKRQRRKAAW